MAVVRCLSDCVGVRVCGVVDRRRERGEQCVCVGECLCVEMCTCHVDVSPAASLFRLLETKTSALKNIYIYPENTAVSIPPLSPFAMLLFPLSTITNNN
jgi:hypothetical protein